MIRHDSLHYHCDDLDVGVVPNLRLLVDYCEYHVYFDDDDDERKILIDAGAVSNLPWIVGTAGRDCHRQRNQSRCSIGVAVAPNDHLPRIVSVNVHRCGNWQGNYGRWDNAGWDSYWDRRSHVLHHHQSNLVPD